MICNVLIQINTIKENKTQQIAFLIGLLDTWIWDGIKCSGIFLKDDAAVFQWCFPFVHNDLFVCLAKPHLMACESSPLVDLQCFLKVHVWGVSQGLHAPCFLRKQALPEQCLKKKNSQVKIRFFPCPWRVGPSPVLFWSLVTPVSQPLAHFSVLREATISPSPLRLQGAPCSFQAECQALRVLIISVLCHAPSPSCGGPELSEKGDLPSPHRGFEMQEWGQSKLAAPLHYLYV